MKSGFKPADVAGVAVLVDRFVERFDPAAVPQAKRVAALSEVEQLIVLFDRQYPDLDRALCSLRDSLRAKPARAAAKPTSAAGRGLSTLMKRLAALALTTAAVTYAVPVAATIPTVSVGGTVFNPLTQSNETVVQVIGSPGYAVLTSANNLILLAQTVGDTFVDAKTGTTYTVSAVTKTTINGTAYVTGVTVKDPSNATTDLTVVSNVTPPTTGTDGTGSHSVTFPSAAGDIGQVSDVRYGDNGSDGHIGVEVCILGVCVGYGPSSGGNGATPAPFTVTVPASHGTITTVSDNLPGIIAGSIGGNGGDGGDAGGFGGSAGQGGTAGAGGTVTVYNYTTIVTSGLNSHGIFVKSAAGSGGEGGTCYVGCSGGSGGYPAAGGSASAYNYGDISTSNTGAVGILVQSLGGNSGDGGSSYGVVGDSGSGNIGGNGGSAYAENGGTIVTHGTYAYGVEVQSIGGNGGNSGNSGGIVAFGGTAGGAGTGGSAKVKLLSTSSITTYGDYAHGAFAQSIGGGGGSTGWSGGVASFGGSAGSGGTGGAAEVDADDGSYIHTKGKGSYGIFAESVGGNGGTASGTGGVFTLGGSGGSGNDGGAVTVKSGATIVTEGEDARGIFAQSVGGGGGNANASGGLVSLGGSGSAGGKGGDVDVELSSASDITTSKAGADGVFAQSIGGGGGAGATSGGLVALGGSGGAGGAGGKVQVINDGSIDTSGDFAHGIFAQSIGGGGGSGGDGGGLAAIGGSGSVASTGGDVTVTNNGSISTGGNMASAMQAQSIGGGGGDGGSTGAVLLAIGGSAGPGSNGGVVTANLSGTLETTGDDSHGLFVQSVGGGGGNGGSATSISAFAGVALGGSGKSGGQGGTVTVKLTQRSQLVDGVTTLLDPFISTTGERSRGIYAQSVGGGGGSGGFAVQASAGAFGSASVALGGSGGSGGDGGTVNLKGDATIFTSGNFSEGLFAQSVGGGGGAGGASVAAALSAGEGFSGSFALSLGGTGGNGGTGGEVTVDSGGNIVTQGIYSTGFIAQSVGGGGGKGGYSVAASGAASDGVAISGAVGIGGDGGNGGVGGTVDASFDGNIATGGEDGLGSDAAGFIAQSIGGGGGTGGFNVSGTLGLSGGASGGAAVGLGGMGGLGGAGGSATGSVGGNVATTGDRSTGVLVQSVGGGGGSGGFNVSGNIQASGGYAGGVAVGLGGSGGGAGGGGTVIGSTSGTVQTGGDQSDGVVFQSVGGGGGSGGFNVSGNLAFGGAAGIGVSVGLGGSGGSGGAGGTVTGNAYDAVETWGDQSRGILVQSAGGGGGAGAFNVNGDLTIGGAASGSIGVGLGGSGGSGGDSNWVLASAKSVTTHGDQSAGFTAQSVGGGGGAGGFNVTGGLNFSGTASGNIGVGLGGSGGSGGSAQWVNAALTGIAHTYGNQSGAIIAQSVGGGGGAGGFNVTGSLNASGTGAVGINVGIGGAGGGGGIARAVTLNVLGSAATEGTDSDAILAQSAGGGGGAGAFNVSGGIALSGTGAGTIGVGIGGAGGDGGTAGAVTANVNKTLTSYDETLVAATTLKDRSRGIVAQSLGGGGGSGAFNVTGGISGSGTGAGGVNVGIGGSGGGGGDADTVTVAIKGYTATQGKDSDAVLAQSVGGGGGAGGFNVSAGISASGTGAGTASVGVGGSGGDGGIGKAVTLDIDDGYSATNTQLIAASTLGNNSRGIVAQSLGGGGGSGGFDVSASLSASGTGAGGVNVGIGGSGGGGGGAGIVNAGISGVTLTSGNDSDAILAQSVGGGGGAGGFNVAAGIAASGKGAGTVNVGIGGSGGLGGDSNDVTLDVNESVSDPTAASYAASTLGDRSRGVVAQSLGGGGGAGGFNVTGAINAAGTGAGGVNVGVGGSGGGGGNATKVTADITGTSYTEGKDSDAILVQSVGGGGGAGGFDVSAGISAAGKGAGTVGVGVGGTGGGGGSSGAVTLDVNQRTDDSANTLYAAVTKGDGARGIVAQSIGGGGGAGGFNVTGLLSAASSGAGNVGVGVGGGGGDGGDSLGVTAAINGDIDTSGKDAGALLLQSVGGGGGAGGFNVTGGISASKDLSGNLMVGVGGFGGGGGDSWTVDGTLTGDIVTRGDGAYGATMQSLGGGGGAGGFNVTGGISLSMGDAATGTMGVGIGGFGGDGGDSALVTGSITGNIVIVGDDAHGALMQSVGGGGGAGGFNVTGGISASRGSSGSIGFGLGGFGGGGGAAGGVDGTLDGDVTTFGDNSFGAMLQSVGGSGGSGGFNVTGDVAFTTSASASIGVSLGIGGFGGDGGQAGEVTGDVTGLYVTKGKDSAGVVAQSLGGGGGAGGINISGALALGTGTAGTGIVGIGGFGGGGGDGGKVTFTRDGDTFTTGAESDGIVVQSVGGGGGRGGIDVSGGITGSSKGTTASLGFGLGGFGGDGGNAGEVTASITGNVLASGLTSDIRMPEQTYQPFPDLMPDYTVTVAAHRDRVGGSNGVLVQSIGGGGGEGGLNVTGQISITLNTETKSRVASLGVGGFGGGGGNAGKVTATIGAPAGSTDRVQVEGIGDDKDAIAIQSIGGGGGQGGLNVSGGISTAGQLVAGVGGFGGAGGTGGEVIGSVDADLFASGNRSAGLLAQSVGGGGGQGGINVSGGISTAGQLVAGVGGFGGAGGTGGEVIGSVDADLFASGNRSAGLLAQSVGGGGGQGGINVSSGIEATQKGTEPSLVFGVGGFGGVGNTAGDVTINQHGQVIVDGVDAHGVLVQSIGGGGGAGGLDVAASITTANGQKKTDGLAIAGGLGGKGGTGADAGDVTLTSNGNVLVNTIATVDPDTGSVSFSGVEFAANAPGVMAQSIGGGGGVGGMNITGAIAPKGSPIAIGIGGTGGVAGDAGDVTLVRGITTAQDGSETATPGLIATWGDGSKGLVAQSIGGGGGDAGMNFDFAATLGGADSNNVAGVFAVGGDGSAGGDGGKVVVRHDGDIVTNGRDSGGILAQSMAGGGGDANFNVGLGLVRNTTAVTLAVGGGTGNGGVAGDVTVDHDGTIITHGDQSVGITAQSLAGGGGNAALNMAPALLARNKLQVGIGRLGGTGGTAGNVDVTSAGTITTEGMDSSGILAQSTGGAGGTSGSITVAGSGTRGKGADAQSYGGSLSVGLEGGAGGKAGTVTVTNHSQISTSGDRSKGIIAQSIGGEGGVGGGVTNIIFQDSGSLQIGIGGKGGSGAVSDLVSVLNDSVVQTSGDDADGILAQSLGGGGGAGGQAMTLDLELAKNDNKAATTVSVAVGGEGGAGATSGDVDVTNQGTVYTTGERSFGIRAQSIGGGGGVGGAVIGAHLQVNGTDSSLDINVGGKGGSGNTAGDVNVTNEGLIYTVGTDAAGISANSIGGGGGDAGTILDLSLAAGNAKSTTLRAVFNIGGNGGSGGAGGDVSVTNRKTDADNSGVIVTQGRGAYGIFAQSIGGGGGNSSSILSLTGGLGGGKDSATFGFNFGAIGGSGNSGGDVTVDNSGTVETFGDGAHGIFAESVGGGGGNGGVVIAGSFLTSAPTNAPLISIGGVGGDGGDAGDVVVDNSGQIITHGANADGILAQSIGGGGGDSSIGIGLTTEPATLFIGNGLSMIVGGATALGGGGTGGNVTVNHSGDITVLGDGSQAIVAQSINGGGGSIGFDFTGITTLPGFAYGGNQDPAAPPDPLLVARAGAENSSGMNSGKVTVNSSGTIGAGGDNGAGIDLQAIGGGGGKIVLHGEIVKLDSDLYTDPQMPLAVSAALGAIGGANNSGGDLEDTHDGQVLTQGNGTPGIRLQSIGGGGGLLVVDLVTDQWNLFGGVDMTLGATGASDSSGGVITHQQTGFVGTSGNFAPGAVLQSIGGGGGSAQSLVQLAETDSHSNPHQLPQTGAAHDQALTPVAVPMATADALTPMAVPMSGTTVTLGASGGTGNDGALVGTTFTGGFETDGDHSPALIVQSIGAGGGYALLQGDPSPTINLGGSSGASGNGGHITIVNNGDVLTQGDGSHGVVLQSIGGGGGAVFGDFTSPTVNLSSANSGDGGDIDFTQNGDIAVTGDGSIGILAQSLGGGGGYVDGAFSGTAGGSGKGGAITIGVSGGIMAYGVDSTGVFAQSEGSTGAGDITLTSDGDIRGGSGTGAGVRFAGGADNLLDTSGTLSSVSGLAFEAGTGNDRLENSGTVVGNLILGGGTNAVHNAAGATFMTIDTLDLQDGAGSSGTFTNDGDLLLGQAAPRYPVDLLAGDTLTVPPSNINPLFDLYSGTDVISVVALDGSFVQNADGVDYFDIAFGPYTSDRVNVTGNATVAGTANITLTWLQDNNPVPLFATGGVGVDNGLNVPDTIALDYKILSGDQGIALTFDSNFGQPFLNSNEQALGHSMDSALEVGGAAGIGRLLALLGNLTTGEEQTYAEIFNELDPESLLMPSLRQFDSASEFGQHVLDCPANGAPQGKTCLWGKIDLHTLKRDSDRGDYSFRQSADTWLRLGLDRQLGNGWTVGVAGGYDGLGTGRFDIDRARTDGSGLHGGIGLGKAFGPRGAGLASVSLSAGRQKNSVDRAQSIFVTGVGHSRFNTSYLQAAAKLGYTIGAGNFFARPEVDGSIISLRQHGFTEQGLSGLGMVGLSDKDVIRTVSPQLTLGLNISPMARFSLTAGGVFHNKGQIEHPFRFIGADPASDPALITTRFDKSAFMAGANFEVIGNDRLKLDFGYHGEFGKSVTSQTGNVEFKLLF